MAPLPVPRDFKKNAAVMTESALRRHYKRGDQTIRRWLIITGVTPVKGKHGEKPWTFKQYDTPEEIRMCLNCGFHDCKGWCSKMAASKGGYLEDD